MKLAFLFYACAVLCLVLLILDGTGEATEPSSPPQSDSSQTSVSADPAVVRAVASAAAASPAGVSEGVPPGTVAPNVGPPEKATPAKASPDAAPPTPSQEPSSPREAAPPASSPPASSPPASSPPATPATKESAWKSLFDGRSLESWKVTNFGGEGEVSVQDGAMQLDFGSSLTGVTYVGDFPRMNYELSLEAKRVAGIDFFCGLTFPVNENYCSFIVGGWAGTVVGLSSIDGLDASENETTRYMNFDLNRWYKIRVQVTPTHIDAWIDNERVVHQNIEGRRVSTRNEVVLSKPMGICAWETRSALRKIQVRKLPSPPAQP